MLGRSATDKIKELNSENESLDALRFGLGLVRRKKSMNHDAVENLFGIEGLNIAWYGIQA